MSVNHTKIILSSIDNWTTWCWIKFRTKLINTHTNSSFLYVIMCEKIDIFYDNEVYKCSKNAYSFAYSYNFLIFRKNLTLQFKKKLIANVKMYQVKMYKNMYV